MTKIPLIAALIVTIAGPAWAWSQVSGNIKMIDQNAREIVLSNGQAYVAQPNVDLTSLSVGDKVVLDTEDKGNRHIVHNVSKAG